MKQSNGSIRIVQTRDGIHEPKYCVLIKGLSGVVDHMLCGYYSLARIHAKDAAAFTGFPLEDMIPDQDPYFYVGLGGVQTRGQYRILANNYTEACSIANASGFGMYPVLSHPFESFPLLGTLEL